MLAARPFSSADELFQKAEQFADTLEKADWLEAFSHHPKIGDLDSLRQKFSKEKWAAGEQSSVASATDKLLEQLAQGNDAYLEKFGYIFIVCATGKSAEEMYAILQSRLANEDNKELKIAAGEQRKISKLRLEKLCQ